MNLLSIIVLLLIIAIAVSFIAGAWQSRGPSPRERLKQRNMPEGKKQIIIRKLIHVGKDVEAIRKTEIFYGITEQEAEDYIEELKREMFR